MTGALLDAQWRSDHPLPGADVAGDKNQRGRVLIVGGSRFVPGALALTFEAAMRVGAGKVQLATVESAALLLGVGLPEAAVAGLPEDGDGAIDRSAIDRLKPLLERADCVVVGCGMSAGQGAEHLVADILSHVAPDATAIVDAGALHGIKDRADATRRVGRRLLLTPNRDEGAYLIGRTRDGIDADPDAAARDIAANFGATVLLKDRTTFISDGGSTHLTFVNEGTGLGISGSGDILAGVLGGLLAQGIDPIVAAGWAVWLHAHAGQATARRIAPFGYLAREVLVELPPLLAEARRASPA